MLELLRDEEKAIIDQALPSVGWLEHYGRDGAERTRDRLVALHRLVEEAVRTRDLGALLAHVRGVALDRHAAGYGQDEVRAAFSALEQAIWQLASARLPADERGWGLSLVGTALGHARSALSRTFDAARGARPPFVDMTSLFRGVESFGPPRQQEDLVHPV